MSYSARCNWSVVNKRKDSEVREKRYDGRKTFKANERWRGSSCTVDKWYQRYAAPPLRPLRLYADQGNNMTQPRSEIERLVARKGLRDGIRWSRIVARRIVRYVARRTIRMIWNERNLFLSLFPCFQVLHGHQRKKSRVHDVTIPELRCDNDGGKDE